MSKKGISGQLNWLDEYGSWLRDNANLLQVLYHEDDEGLSFEAFCRSLYADRNKLRELLLGEGAFRFGISNASKVASP